MSKRVPGTLVVEYGDFSGCPGTPTFVAQKVHYKYELRQKTTVMTECWLQTFSIFLVINDLFMKKKKKTMLRNQRKPRSFIVRLILKLCNTFSTLKSHTSYNSSVSIPTSTCGHNSCICIKADVNLQSVTFREKGWLKSTRTQP